jgi:hypothetical protein
LKLSNFSRLIRLYSETCHRSFFHVPSLHDHSSHRGSERHLGGWAPGPGSEEASRHPAVDWTEGSVMTKADVWLSTSGAPARLREWAAGERERNERDECMRAPDAPDDYSWVAHEFLAKSAGFFV